jgi:exonuclease III
MSGQYPISNHAPDDHAVELLGYQRNYSDLRTLLRERQPICVCIQETMLKAFTPTPPHNYHVETFSDTPNPRPGTGLLILVRHDSACIRLVINSNIPAMAIQTNLKKKMHTICNIYIPHGQQVTVEELRNLSH